MVPNDEHVSYKIFSSTPSSTFPTKRFAPTSSELCEAFLSRLDLETRSGLQNSSNHVHLTRRRIRRNRSHCEYLSVHPLACGR